MLRTRVRVGPASGLLVSALFAVLLTVIGAFEMLIPQLAPVYGEPAAMALRVPYSVHIVHHGDAKLADVSFESRRIVVPRGTLLDAAREEHRVAVEHDARRRPPSAGRLASAFSLYLFVLLVLSNYFQRFGHPRLRLLRSQAGLFALMAATLAIAKILLVATALPAFWVPVSAVALWAAVGFDRRTALLTDLGLSFLLASLLRFDMLLLAVLVMRGITVALLFFNRKQPRQMVLAGTASGLVASLGYLSLEVLLEGSASVAADVALGIDSEILACVGGGVVSGLLGNLLRGPAERAMGHVSRSRLLDLTDIESPLLRKMAEEAPGSWEHSRAMANLAEAAAASIGADSLLTRVGAYYHDLGKTVQPKYFIENLAPGETSPHDALPPEVSADAIMAHVVLGTKILREGGVPEPVVEFAYTHHGTQLVEFFWNKYRERKPGEGDRTLDESHFRYPGMKPMSKETAILMLVDSIEAASRTIDGPNKDKFEEMIRRIIFTKLAHGQLDESGLTLTDMRILVERMASTLVNMYHGRIKYPWQRDREKAEKLEAAKLEAAKLEAAKLEAAKLEAAKLEAEKKAPAPAEERHESTERAVQAAVDKAIAAADQTPAIEVEVEMPSSRGRSRPLELRRLTGSEDDAEDEAPSEASKE